MFKRVICRHFHLLFILPFLATSLFLLQAPLIWDEDLYLKLASNVLTEPLSVPSRFLYTVPHPPLLWYLLALFYSLPRLAVLSSSLACVSTTFYACKRFWGDRVAQTSVACLISTNIYPLFSLVLFNDILATTFMTISTLSLLIWLKNPKKKFLFSSGLSATLASLSKYTAVPILTLTFIAWVVLFRKRLGLRKFVVSLAVLMVSFLPVMLWIYEVSVQVGGVVEVYKAKYILSDPLEFSLNFLFYVKNGILLAGIPLVLWKKNLLLRKDSQLILIYASVIFIFFLFLKQRYDRYLLPLSPALAVISGMALAEKSLLVKSLTLFPQFAIAFFILTKFIHY